MPVIRQNNRQKKRRVRDGTLRLIANSLKTVYCFIRLRVRKPADASPKSASETGSGMGVLPWTWMTCNVSLPSLVDPFKN